MKRQTALALLTAAITFHVSGEDRLEKAVATARANEFRYCTDENDPQSVVCRAVEKASTPAEVVERVARGLHVSKETAQAIALVLLPQVASIQRGITDEAWVNDRVLLERALASESNRAAVVAALSQCAAETEKPRVAFEEILPMVGDDTAAALAAADAVRSEDATEIFLGSALTRHNDEIDIIEAIGAHSNGGLLRAAFGPVQLLGSGARFRHKTTEDTAALREAVAGQIQGIANLGLADVLMSAYDALPPSQRERVIADHQRGISADIAAAAILTGRNGMAQQIARTRTAAPRTGDEDAQAWDLVAASDPTFSGDPFDIIVSMISKARFNGSTVRTLLFARFAEQHGYASLTGELLHDATRFGDGTEPTAPFRAETSFLLARVRSAIADENSRATQLRPVLNNASVRSSLAQPRIVPFAEHRLEEAATPGDSPIVVDCSDAAGVAAQSHLPPFVNPIRMERRGEEIVAIAISSALDPVGELGLGGYWAVRSTDGGATWKSYYTGLRENMPYVVKTASRLPLLEGEHLRVEVDVQELDTNSITFPPVALRTKRTQKGLYLDFPWEELTRDTDGDGLTDLMEERLTTDPREIDTDGDGVPDGEDLLPRVPLRPGRDTVAEVIASVLDRFALGGGRIVVGIGRDALGAEIAQNSCEVQTSRVCDPVLFIVGDPSHFAPLTLARRTVVLTQEEIDAYTKKFGPTYAARIEHLAINPAGTRAIFELNQSWTGATYILTKTDKGWQVTIAGGWIT